MIADGDALIRDVQVYPGSPRPDDVEPRASDQSGPSLGRSAHSGTARMDGRNALPSDLLSRVPLTADQES